MNQLIRCINCGEIFLRTPFDQCPEYEAGPVPSSGVLPGTERDDFEDFLKNHQGHRLEDLKIIDDSFVSEKAYLEPVKTSYFRATNGKERFVIKKFRERIDEPLKYQLVAGDYSLKCNSIEIQSEAIVKQLEAEFQSPPLEKAEISAFLELFRRIAKTVDVRNLERVPEESSHPLEVYYKLDDVSLVYLLRNCRQIFKGQAYVSMEEFINRHWEDGVLLLKATYQILLKETVQPKSKLVPLSVPLGKKGIATNK